MIRSRHKHDHYATESALVDVLLNTISADALAYCSILEPCSGEEQKIALALYDKVPRVDSITTNDFVFDADYNGDATDINAEIYKRNYDWVITNPPYNQALPIIKNSLSVATIGAAFLLRLSFLEPTRARAPFWNAYADTLRYVQVLNPRPRFRYDTKGTDSVTSAWFIFDKNFSWNRLNLQCPFVFTTGWRNS